MNASRGDDEADVIPLHECLRLAEHFDPNIDYARVYASLRHWFAQFEQSLLDALGPTTSSESGNNGRTSLDASPC